jgi:hypothetical protein
MPPLGHALAFPFAPQLQREDIQAAIANADILDFLVNIV